MIEVRPEIIERIKKLLELTTSPNENEAQRAMESAKRLMLKYSVQYEDLSAPELKENIVQEPYWNDNFNRPGAFTQAPRILHTIGTIFGVYTIIRPHSRNDKDYVLVGFPANLTVAKFAIDSIMAQGTIEAKAEYKKFRSVSFGENFWQGYSQGLYKKFGKSDKEELGLTVYNKVKEFVNSIAKGTHRITEYDGNAVQSGIAAGLRAELRRGLETRNEGKLLK